MNAQVNCVYGSYTGTGSSQTIDGIGFTPALVIVKGGSYGAYVKTATMSSTGSRLWANNSSLVTNAITGFTSDGFDVGNTSGVNNSGTTYYFVAISSSFSGMKTGSYTGNNASSRNISLSGGGLALFAIIVPASSGGGAVTCVDGSIYNYGYNSVSGSGNGGGSGGAPSSGLQVYTGFNSSGNTYHYAAFVNSSGKSNGNSYSGNNTDNRNYTGLGFDPKAVFIFKAGDTDVQWKTKNITTDNTLFLTATSSATNRIQSFISGGFQLGNNTDVNGSGNTYYYMGLGGSEILALPIELFHFDARCTADKRAVEIHWTTSSEINNDYFTVEKSDNGITFKEIGMVKGAGNSNTLIDYQLTDYEYVQGKINYYRLKQTDFDGKSKTFPMVTIDCNQNNRNFDLTLLDNPITQSSIKYNLNSDRNGLVQMCLYNIHGREIDKNTFYHRQGLNTYSHTLPSSLPRGVYLLSVSDGINKKTVKLIKK